PSADPGCSLNGPTLPWVTQYPVIDSQARLHVRIELWDEDKFEDAGVAFGPGQDDSADINPLCQRCLSPGAVIDHGLNLTVDLQNNTWRHEETNRSGSLGTATDITPIEIAGNIEDGQFGRIRFLIQRLQLVPVVLTINDVTQFNFRTPFLDTAPW